MDILHFDLNADYSIKVAKFGGSHFRSAEDFESAANYMKSNLKEDELVIPFVSAVYGMTDLLDELYQVKDDSEEFEDQLTKIMDVYDPFISSNPEEEVIREDLRRFEEQKDNLSQAEVKGSGEHHSAHILKGVLKKHGIDSIAFSGYQAGIYLTESRRLDLEASRENIEETVMNSLKKDKIPVIGGYQGRLISESSKYALGGRGSSDLFAAAGAASINADKLEIIKDEKGICPVDPNLWPNEPLEKISYDEMIKLSWRGNPVIYPTAVSMARDNDVPILVKKIGETDFKGTLVSEESITTDEEPYAGISLNRAQMITVKDSAFGTEEGCHYLSRISEAVENIRLISSDPEEISFTLIENSSELIGNKEKEVEEHLKEYGYSPEVSQDRVSMVSICGDAMRDRIGTFTEIVQTIAETNSSIIMGGQTNEQESAPSISFCFSPKKGEKVVKALGEKFFKRYKKQS